MVFTPYHALAAERILKCVSDKSGCVILSTLNCKDTFPGCKFVYFVSIRSFWDLIKEIFSQQRKKKLLSLGLHNEAGYRNVHLFIPHYFHLIANYLANYLLLDQIKSLNIIPDGTLNYYRHEQDNYFLRRQFVNQITAFLIGVKYKKFKGYMVNPFKKVDVIYSYCPELTICDEVEVRQIVCEKSKLAPEANNILVIGTDTFHLKNKNTCKSISNLIIKNTFSLIYYKKHPSVISDEYVDIIRKMVAPREVIELGSNHSILQITKEKSIKHIYAFGFSTVNIELQDTFDCMLNSYACMPDSEKYLDEFKKIATKFNIEIYED